MLNTLKIYFNLLITNRSNNSEIDAKSTTVSTVNSLAYLSYKSRGKKGLITAETACPTVFFGDEWAL